MTPDLTNPQKILLAAGGCPEPFTFADVIVAAYVSDRQRFGLPGFEAMYPDSNKVATYLMGERGLRSRGMLVRVGPKRYAVTDYGRRLIAEMQAGEPITRLETRPAAHPGRKLGAEVDRMLRTRAYARYVMGQAGAITWDDAVPFWSVDQEGFGTPLARRFEQRMATCEKAISGAAGGIRFGDRDVTAIEVQRLGELDARLRDMFARQLKRVGVTQKERAA